MLTTAINHGYTNADGSRREDHCCGCWHVESDGWQKVLAKCNECGEERDLAAMLQKEPDA